MPRLAAAPPLVYQVRRLIQLNNAPAAVSAKARTCRVPNAIVDLDQGDRVDERLKRGNNIGGS